VAISGTNMMPRHFRLHRRSLKVTRPSGMDMTTDTIAGTTGQVTGDMATTHMVMETDRVIGTEVDTAADMAGTDITRTSAEIQTSERARPSVEPSAVSKVRTSAARSAERVVVAAGADVVVAEDEDDRHDVK
jgi:hypothetical protein